VTDSADTYGVRGAGASWQARFGMQLNERDLLFSVRREPVSKRLVFDVPYDMFSKGFSVEEVSDKPDPQWSREVAKVLDDLNVKSVLRQLFVFERLFGWSVLALTYVDFGVDMSKPLDGAKEIRELVPYSSLNCSVQASDEEKDEASPRFGLPVLYTFRRSPSSGAQKKLHFSRVIHCATRLLDHPWRGLSCLEVEYDDLTVLRNERWAVGETLVRQVGGFADITLKGAKKKQVDDFTAEQNLHQLNTRSFFAHDENAIVDWVGSAGKALDPGPFITPTMESLSCGARIPLSHLRGANAGTLAGSDVNDREYWGGVAALQELGPTPVLWELIDRLMDTGQIRRVNDYRVVWPSGFELNETQKASIMLQEAQARNLKVWCTLDEIRAEEGKLALPNDEGKVLLGSKKSAPQVVSSNSGESGVPSAAVSDNADSNRVFGFLLKFRRKKKP
jgi:phage-related protein (TIGR01555 family)